MGAIIIPILVMCAIGIIMGLLANNKVRYRGLGLERNIMTGLFGAYIGGILNMTGTIRDVLGIKLGGPLGILIWATVGSAILLFVVGLVRKKPSDAAE